jgi:hypothetical protein
MGMDVIFSHLNVEGSGHKKNRQSEQAVRQPGF